MVTKFDPNKVAELKAMLAEQEAAKMVAADEIRAEIAVADENLRNLRAKLAELVPPSNLNPKRPRTSNPSTVNNAPNPLREAIREAVANGANSPKAIIETVKADANGNAVTLDGSVVWYHLKSLLESGTIVRAEHGSYAIAQPSTPNAA